MARYYTIKTFDELREIEKLHEEHDTPLIYRWESSGPTEVNLIMPRGASLSVNGLSLIKKKYLDMLDILETQINHNTIAYPGIEPDKCYLPKIPYEEVNNFCNYLYDIAVTHRINHT